MPLAQGALTEFALAGKAPIPYAGYAIKINGHSGTFIIGRPMTAVHDPLDLVCGDDWEFAGRLEDAFRRPINLIGVLSISWRLDSLDGSQNFLAISLGSGITVTNLVCAEILVDVPSAETTALAPGIYRDYLRVTLADGSVLTEWTGIIRVCAAPA